MQLTSRFVALPLAAVLASGALFASTPAQAHSNSKTYKAGGIALGVLGAYLLSKGKTVEGAAALGGGYLAYKKGQKESRNQRYGYDNNRYGYNGNYNNGAYGNSGYSNNGNNGYYNGNGGYYNGSSGYNNGTYYNGNASYNSGSDYRYNDGYDNSAYNGNNSNRQCRDQGSDQYRSWNR